VTAHIPGVLGRYRVQLVEAPSWMSGFILAHQPVLHVRPDEGRYGFASQLAVGDADLIMTPIQRRLLACYTGQPLLNFTLKTKRSLRIINAALCRNAMKEIACHRDDVREASYVMKHINQTSETAVPATKTIWACQRAESDRPQKDPTLAPLGSAPCLAPRHPVRRYLLIQDPPWSRAGPWVTPSQSGGEYQHLRLPPIRRLLMGRIGLGLRPQHVRMRPPRSTQHGSQPELHYWRRCSHSVVRSGVLTWQLGRQGRRLGWQLSRQGRRLRRQLGRHQKRSRGRYQNLSRPRMN